MSDALKDILKDKYNTNTLAQLYIAEPNIADTTDYCLTWLKSLLSSFLQVNSDLINHSDLLFLYPEKDSKQYNQTQIQEIFQFANYKANSLNRKFLIIPNAQYLSEINSNKLLKTFEEPPVELTVFILNPMKSLILPTILSRAIQIRLKLNPTQVINQLEHFKNTNAGFIEFCKEIDDKEVSIQTLLSNLTTLYINSQANEKTLTELKQTIQSIEEDILFHNSPQNTKLKIFNLLTKLN